MRKHTTSLDDAKRLADLCRRFEEVVINLPILTFCETKELAIKRVLVRVSKALVSAWIGRGIRKMNS